MSNQRDTGLDIIQLYAYLFYYSNLHNCLEMSLKPCILVDTLLLMS